MSDWLIGQLVVCCLFTHIYTALTHLLYDHYSHTHFTLAHVYCPSLPSLSQERLSRELEAERQANMGAIINDMMKNVKEQKVNHMKKIKRLNNEKMQLTKQYKDCKEVGGCVVVYVVACLNGRLVNGSVMPDTLTIH